MKLLRYVSRVAAVSVIVHTGAPHWAVSGEDQPPPSPPPAKPATDQAAPATPATGAKIPDLIAKWEKDRDVEAGTWAKTDQGLTVESGQGFRTVLPLDLSGRDYDMTVEFTRHSGNMVGIYLPIGETSCLMEFNGWNGLVHGIGCIDGKMNIDPTNPATARPGKLENGTRYKASCSVRLKEKDADITISLDDKQIIHFAGPRSRITPHPFLALKDKTTPGLGVFDAKTTYHKVSVNILPAAQSVSAMISGEVAAKLPAPDKDKIAASLKEIKELFKKEYADRSVAGLKALSVSMAESARQTKKDTTARFVFYQEAAMAAAPAGDIGEAMKIIAEMGQFYDFNDVPLKLEVLNVAGKSMQPKDKTSAFTREVAGAYTALIDQAALSDDYALALQIHPKAVAAARADNDTALSASLTARERELKDSLAEYNKTKDAREKLKTAPDDPSARQILGRYYCFVKGDWPRGLLLLEKCDDAALQELAKQDLAAPAGAGEATAQATLGDSYAALADKEQAAPRKAKIRERAEYWYRKSLEGLDGLQKVRVEKKLASFPSVATAPRNVPLMPLVNIEKDAIAGKWKLENGQLFCAREGDKLGTLELPYQPPEEYDVRAVISRTSGKGTIAIMLVKNGVQFAYAFSCVENLFTGFENVSGKSVLSNATTTKFSPNNNQRYSVLIQVRKDGLKVTVDGKQVVVHKTDYKDISPSYFVNTRNQKYLGVAAGGADVIFHQFEVTEITGKGKIGRGT